MSMKYDLVSQNENETWWGEITMLFWVITQRVVVISYWRFGTTCRDL